MRALIVALVLGLVLAGCGGNSEVFEKAFGEDVKRDSTAMKSTFKSLGAATNAFLDLSATLTKEDLPGARKALDRVDAALQQAESDALDVNNAKLSTTFDGYITAMKASAKAADRWMAYFEDEDSPADKQLEKRLLANLERTAGVVERLDRDLMDQLIAAGTPEEQKQMREMARKTQAENEKRLAE